MKLQPTFKDDILAPSETMRRYEKIPSTNGTFSLEDVTEYTQVGDVFGAKELNQIITAINNLEEKSEWVMLHDSPIAIYDVVTKLPINDFDLVCMDFNAQGMKHTMVMHVNKTDEQYYCDSFSYLHTDNHYRTWNVRFKTSGRYVTEAHAAMKFDNGTWSDTTGALTVTKVYAKKNL